MAQDLTGLNSLRQALTPYDDVKFELNLNRHPKAHKNKSLVYAENMKLSNDGAVLENEESIKINNYINDVLTDYYNEFKIIHIIPCNTELVLFVKGSENNNFQIWRYREKTNNYDETIARFYSKGIEYNGGKFSSTFTYTSNNSLIIAFCEYDSTDTSIMNPMMTINLGTFMEGDVEGDPADLYNWNNSNYEFNDRELEPYKLPICPEVSLPQITNSTFIKGKSYIGTYYVYIRYKINKYDYTQWFNIGYPIVVDDKHESIIHKKVTKNDIDKSDNNNEELAGASETSKTFELKTYINTDTDLINKCVDLNIYHNSLLYDYCQIGFVCVAKTYTKYYISSNINLTNNINITTNIEELKEEIFNTNLYENYYNVKNIINKNNKLYISNYKVKQDIVNNTDNIKLSLITNDSIKDTYETNDELNINNITLPLSILSFEFDTFKIPLGIRNSDGWETINTKYINLAYYLNHIGLANLVKSKKIKIIGFKNDHSTNDTYIIDDLTNCYIAVQEATILSSASDYNTDTKYKLIGIKDINGDTYYNRLPVTNFKIDYSGKGSQFHKFKEVSYKVYFIDDDGNELNEILFNNYYSELENTINIYPENYIASNIYRYNNLDNLINENFITSLLHGEIYDFYIHFIDKYGHITDGYKLKNNDIDLYVGPALDEPENFIKPAFYITKDNSLIALNYYDKCIKKVNNEDVININYFYGQFYKSDDVTLNLHNNVLLDNGRDFADVIIGNIGNELFIDNLKNEFLDLLLLNDSIKYDITWGDILDYIPIEVFRFINYKNSKNENFFKVPKLSNNEGDIPITLKVNLNDITTYGNYVSYFISHKKLEKTYVLNGIGNKNQLINVLLNTKYKTDNIVKTYSITEDLWNTAIYDKCTIQRNVVENKNFTTHTNILNKVAYAGDSQNNRRNRNTTLYLSDVTEDFTGNELNGNYPLSYVELMNVNKNKYINSDKKLYRLGNIQYTNCIIQNGLNAIYDKHLCVKYGDINNGVPTLTSSNGLGSYGNVYLYEIFGFFDYDELGMYLSERAKIHDVFNKGETETDIELNKIGTDIFYDVITTLNLFNYKISNIYDTWVDFYQSFNKNNDYLNEFNRTIYRSQVISDEGRTNNWRWFENDAYKNIEENKGNITNLLAIGNYLYVHTEHSLYAFSEDNTLSMNNQNLQVATPDIFETEYKEVFISSLGYGGLQDKDAWVSGQFGYIWFNNDTKQILKVYGNSMDIISNDIKEWLENCNILNVRFANDIKNNRILMNIKIQMLYYNQNVEKDIILSYNILSKTFISLHDYSFNNTYNTKNNLYFLDNNINITKFIEDNYGKNIDKEKQYKVYFIINKYYNTVKYLENIVYKLRKRIIKNDVNMLRFVDIDDFINFPVEQKLLPYSGKTIRVFNDLVDTDWLDCDTSNNGELPNNEIKDFEKPYWDLGNWNFNFLRDSNHNNSDSRLYGNYFIIAFNLGNIEQLVEFESLDTNLTQDKNL